mgnify:CR=1 FL=1
MLNWKPIVGAACLVLAPMLSAQAESLRYEKIYSQIREVDNRLILTIDETGLVNLHRPGFMPHAGTYEWQLSASELEQLWQDIAPEQWLAVDMQLLKRNLDQRSQSDKFYSSDSDVSRLEWNDGRGPARASEISGLAGLNTLFPQIAELQQLTATEQRLWQWLQTQLNHQLELAQQGARS